jgi:hypothetical protein
MPVVVVESGNVRVGKPVEALLCDANIGGLPDRRTAVPVQMTLIREGRTLKLEPGNDIRDIVSTTGTKQGVLKQEEVDAGPTKDHHCPDGLERDNGRVSTGEAHGP